MERTEELAQLDEAQRDLQRQMQDVQARRKQVLVDLDEQVVAEENARRTAIAEAHAAMRSLMVLGIPLDKLKTKAHDAGLRIVSVHSKVHEWLRTALPSANDEHFSQLLSALVETLIENRRQVRAVIEELKASSDSQYFQAGCEGMDTHHSVEVYVIAKGIERKVIADYLTAWAVEWNKTVELEEQK